MIDAKKAASVPLTEWQPTVSGNAELKLSTVSAGAAPALRMAFDFKGGKGFVVARRAFALDMPGEYAVTFRLRGRAPRNNLEIKLVDDSGLNVWRHVLENLELPQRWKRFTIESRDIDFAWGPSSGRGIARLGFIEVALVAGPGGAGTARLADLRIEDRTPAHAPVAWASSAQSGHWADDALTERGWKPAPDDHTPWLSIDCTEPRVLGGMIIDWLGAAPPRGFRVRSSLNGRRFKTVYAAPRAGGARSYVYLPNLRSRFVRVELAGPSEGASVRLQPFDFSRSIEAFWYTIAAAEPRGWHPRWAHREQSEWTPIGTATGTECALMNKDGMIEVRHASFSVEPMLLAGGRLYTWADVAASCALREAWLPVPSVCWNGAGWRLCVEAEGAEGDALRVRYRLENSGATALEARLFLVVRPFQVSPPWQRYREVGGVSRITQLSFGAGTLSVNECTRITPGEGARFGAMTFDEGFIAARLASGAPPTASAVQDAFGFATGALEFELTVSPSSHAERTIDCAPAEAAAIAATFDWQGRLRARQWRGNGWAAEAIRCALTATAHVLITRSGPALQPGPRRYTRSWIRDGAMMSAALLRMGHRQEVAEFIAWYAPHQREDGFVPCCVDKQGVDWLVEHDSHGELIALIADYHRFAQDSAWLERSFAFVERAVGYIDGALGADGLMPISVSHEGYLAQPVHAYWDDFWALRGVRDASALAAELGHAEQATRWTTLAARIESSLCASIEATRAAKQLDFIPGSLEWADFDPTATANAIYLLDVLPGLDRRAVQRTFDKYLADWRAKRGGETNWANYTPYEIRIIGALVRLGQREAALELLKFFLSDRRPEPWNQWPEIAWRDRSAPAHVGDLPHTWIAAEYVLALRSLFAYERESDRSLILAAGLAPEWLEGEGVSVGAMPTLYGELSYRLRRRDARTLVCRIENAVGVGIILRPPLDASPVRVTLNGRAIDEIEHGSIAVSETPCEVIWVSN